MRVVQMSAFGKPQTAMPKPAPAIVKENTSPVFDIKSFKSDDWILLAIIAVLILEGSDDYLLLLALGYLFYVGIK